MGTFSIRHLPLTSSAAGRIAASTLTNQKLPCATTQVVPDLTAFTKPVGTPATVTVRVVCEVPVADLGLSGFGGTVTVEETAGPEATILELHVAPEDMGKVIGKQGRIAKALRAVVRAATAKDQKPVFVEIQ